MGGVRRSGRIAREIGITILGTDTQGRVFSEETTTVVLSRHGAGVVSRQRFAPDEILILRRAGSDKEAEARLVGHMGEEKRGYVYGVEFVDAKIDFWEIEFPPAETIEQAESVELECGLCRKRETVRQTEIEADVYAINQNYLRYCETCGVSTLWLKAGPARVLPATPPRQEMEPPRASTTEVHRVSAYSGEFPEAEALLTTSTQVQTVEAPRPVGSAGETRAEKPEFSARFSNRRQHVRTRVAFTACIRYDTWGEEVVECDNISKGGLSFRSRKTYDLRAEIEVALPYSPGSHAIFVPATIRHVEQLPGGTLYKYGAEYTRRSKNAGDL